MTNRSPDPIDVHVGQRIRHRRMVLRISQEKLGEALGVSFQQIQKYERGSNRISASRLYHIAHILEKPVSYFYEEVPSSVNADGYEFGGLEEGASTYQADFTQSPEAIELCRAYFYIRDLDVRKSIFQLLKAISAQH